VGTLRSTQIVDDDSSDDVDARPRAACQGYVYNGVTLGEPIELDGDPSTFEWDDSAFPNGTCEVVDDELVVTPDPDPFDVLEP
jgi:hypothetical protein